MHGVQFLPFFKARDNDDRSSHIPAGISPLLFEVRRKQQTNSRPVCVMVRGPLFALHSRVHRNGSILPTKRSPSLSTTPRVNDTHVRLFAFKNMPRCVLTEGDARLRSIMESAFAERPLRAASARMEILRAS